jgi:hypothetical protein
MTLNASPIEAPLIPFKINVTVACLMAVWGTLYPMGIKLVIASS